MECRHGNFWIGLGIGSILGAVAYRLSRTAKAKQLESEIYNAIERGQVADKLIKILLN